MTSKVLVKMPEVQFSQVNNVKKAGSADIIQNINGDPMLRIAQLEQNIRFLQEQHHLMLTGLHREIETLKHKNRDLQLQLVFLKSNENKQSSSDEPSDDAAPKEEGENDSEKCERLEKELAAAKTALETSIARTTALQNLLQHHKIQESHEGNQRKLLAEGWSTSVGGAGGPSETETRLQVRLEEAEQLVRRLRAESQHQRRELQSIKSSLNAGGRGNGSGRPPGQSSGSSNNYRGGMIQNVFNKLPPLQQQQQQQSQQPQQHFIPHHQTREYHNWNRNNRKSIDKPDQSHLQAGSSDGMPDLSITNLQYNNGNQGTSQNHHRRGNNSGYGNNYYYRNSDRNYKQHREEDVQYRNYNTPADNSDGENEPINNDVVKTSSYRNKRNHNNRYHDK